MSDVEITPVHLPAPSEEAAQVEKVTLFTIGDTEYQVPKTPGMGVGLRYLRNLRAKGEDVAVAELMVEMLGEDGFDALCDYPDLTPQQFEAVGKTVQKLAMAGVEQTRPNSGRGQRK